MAAEIPPHTSARDGWAAALNADGRGSLLIRIGELLQLIEEARQAVLELPDPDERRFYLEPFEVMDRLVETLTFYNSIATMQKFSPMLTSETIYALEAVSRALRKVVQRPAIDVSTQRELLNGVRALIDDVLAFDDLTPDAKLYIVRLLKRAEEALLAFRLVGFEDVSASIAALAAGTIVIQEQPIRGWFLDRLGKIWRTLVTGASGVEVIGSAAQTIAGAIDGVEKLGH
ncbi:hypothetical protein [Micromonospora sp. DPT]|uniref:hypothetical protein n=1 Tax=Micromonospora sp. DPT TaxID=3142975 RepID=UPI003208CB7B